MNRKQRRAEQFGHFSDNRKFYAPTVDETNPVVHGVAKDIIDGYIEESDNLLDVWIEMKFGGIPNFKSSPTILTRMGERGNLLQIFRGTK